MPVMDGFQATQEIRSRYSHLQIQIVALTAYTTDVFEERCLSSGMDSFLTKPIGEDKIRDALKRV